MYSIEDHSRKTMTRNEWPTLSHEKILVAT